MSDDSSIRPLEAVIAKFRLRTRRRPRPRLGASSPSD